MKKIIFSIFLLIFVFSPGLKLIAQLDSLSNGDIIRIKYQVYPFRTVICSFEKIFSDSLFVEVNGKSLTVPLEQIQKIEIFKNKERNTVTGIIMGSVIGGLALGIAMHIEEQQAEGWGKIGSPGFGRGFVLGLIIGGGIGALIGYNTYSDKWSEIAISKRY